MDNSQIVTVTVKDSDPIIVKEIVKSLAEQSQKAFNSIRMCRGKILTDPELQEKLKSCFRKFNLSFLSL